MDIAILSNGDSSYGLLISKMLIRLGFRVYSIGGRHEGLDFDHPDYLKVEIDPTDLKAWITAVNKIREREGAIHTMILQPRMEHAGPKRLFEMDPKVILDASVVNFTVPMMLTRLVAEDVANLQGYFFYVTWDRAKTGPVDPILDACGEGIHRLSEGVFGILRVLGARACRISLLPNTGKGIPESASSDHPQTKIQAEEMAGVIEAVIRSNDLNSITEVRIRPRVERGDLRLPRTHIKEDDFSTIRLPSPEDFPSDEILIPTRKPRVYLKVAEVEFPDEAWDPDDGDFESDLREPLRDPLEDEEDTGEGKSRESDNRGDRRGTNNRAESRDGAGESRQARSSEDSGGDGEGDAKRKKKRRRRRNKRSSRAEGDEAPAGFASEGTKNDAREGEGSSEHNEGRTAEGQDPKAEDRSVMEAKAAPVVENTAGGPGESLREEESSDAGIEEPPSASADDSSKPKKPARKRPARKRAPRKRAAEASEESVSKGTVEEKPQGEVVTGESESGDHAQTNRGDD